MYLFFIIGAIIFASIFVGNLIVGADNTNLMLLSIILFGFFAIAAIFTYDFPSDQDKCERSGFTWQLTEELVETSDGFVQRGYCINL